MSKSNNQCNQREACKKCQKLFWLGSLCQMENWKEHGVFCEGCFDETEKRCRRCNKQFIKREYTDKELKEEREWDELMLKKHGIERERQHRNISLCYCRGSAPCHIKVNKNCQGHRIRQYGIFCSSECSNDYYKIINKTSRKFKEWKKVAEKRGFRRCQEENVFHKHPETAKWLLEGLNWNKKKLACWGYARTGEKYCEDCKEGRGEGKKVKENSWQEDYRKYWSLTDENTCLSNRDSDKENSMIVNCIGSDLQDKINDKEKKLEQLIKEDKSSSKIKELKLEIEKLKSQQKSNSIGENPVKNNNIIAYSIVGLLLVSLVGFAVYASKNKPKDPKIK